MLIQGVEREKGTTHTENLQQRHTLYPAVGDGHQHKLFCHQRQAKQCGESKEGSETKHLAENTSLTVALIIDFCQHGLRHLLYHARNGVESHGVPLHGLGEVAHCPHRKQIAKDER